MSSQTIRLYITCYIAYCLMQFMKWSESTAKNKRYIVCGICEAWLMAAVWIIRQVFSSAAAFSALVSLCENKQIWCNEQILCGIFQSQNLANICCCWIFWMNAPRCERNRLECEAICRYMFVCMYVWCKYVFHQQLCMMQEESPLTEWATGSLE